MSGRVVRAYAALGDSFTAGRDSIDAERWADLLAAGMRRVNPDLRYENLAVDGATSAEVLEGQVEPGLALDPDFVTVICGANDVLLATRPDVAGYAERIDAIFKRLREDATLSRDDLADAYAAEHLTAPAAAASGWVDEVIEPEASRESLAWALRSLRGR